MSASITGPKIAHATLASHLLSGRPCPVGSGAISTTMPIVPWRNGRGVLVRHWMIDNPLPDLSLTLYLPGTLNIA